jgi:tetratricopeptide (TPR) repeat protein
MASAASATSTQESTATKVVGTEVHLPDGLTTAATHFGLEVVLVGVFALVVGLVLKGHLAKALKESLEAGIERTSNKLSLAMPAVAAEFTSTIQAEFRQQLSRAVDAVIGEVKSARSDFQIRMIETAAPKDVVGDAVRRAAAYRDAGKWLEAEEVLKDADSRDFAVLQALVTLYLEANPPRPQEALSLLASARGSFPDHPKYFWLLATVHIALKDRDSAVEASTSYVERCTAKGSKEDLADALISLGYCHFWFDEFPAAIDRTEEALQMLSGSETKAKYVCQSNLAFYLAASGKDKARSLRLAAEAVSFLGDEPLSTDTMGYVRMRFAGSSIDELALAREDFLRAAQIDPSLDAAYRHLAEVDAQISRIKKRGPR